MGIASTSLDLRDLDDFSLRNKMIDVLKKIKDTDPDYRVPRRNSTQSEIEKLLDKLYIDSDSKLYEIPQGIQGIVNSKIVLLYHRF